MSARDYRESARFALSGKWKSAVLITFVASLLGGLVTSASVNISIDESILAQLPDVVKIYFLVMVPIACILSIVQLIIGGVVQLGYCRYLLDLHDGAEGEVMDLFSEFYRFADGFCLVLLRTLFTFLWTLLFIIPGFIAAYRYAMSPFIMAENPGMTARETLRASSDMMQGHKWRLFCLTFSFMGWVMLNVLTLGIGSLWLNPYMNAAYAAFYRDLSRTPF